MLELFATGEVIMNQRKHSDRVEGDKGNLKVKTYKNLYTETWNHHHSSGRNSSEDPDIASTQAERHLSNARNHPQADLQARTSTDSSTPRVVHTPSQSARLSSNHVHNRKSEERGVDTKSHDSTPSNGKRQRSVEREEQEDSVWTEHISSSGRVYYYNKQLDKSQWERPKASLKKAKTESSHASAGSGKTTVGSTSSSASKSLHHEGHRSSGESVSKGSGHTRSERGGGHSHRERGSNRSAKDGGGGRDINKYASVQGERNKHGSAQGERTSKLRDSHYHSRHSSRSSHSRSSSPIGLKHGTSHSSSSKSSAHSRSRTHGAASASEKAHKSKSYSSHSNTHHPSVSPASTPKGVQLISPTTPSSGPALSTPSTLPIPSNFSQTLSTTQHLIDQNSIILEKRQRILAGETTPTPATANQTPNSSLISGTPPTHHAQPLARKKLPLPAQTQQPLLANSYSTVPLSLPQQNMGGVMYQPQVGVAVVGSPQASVDAAGLHPLQKALLLQNQQQQQQQLIQQQQQQQMLQQQQVLQQQQQVVYPAGVVEPNLQAPPTAIPPHMNSLQSPHPTSPLLQSPVPITQHATGGTPGYPAPAPAGMQPLTPLQPNIFAMPARASLNYDPSAVVPVTQLSLMNSKVLQKPMSRLAYQHQVHPGGPQPGPTLDVLQFPDVGVLEKGVGSLTDMELVDRGLAGYWLQHYETMSKQVDQCQLETMRRKTVESFFLSGQLMKKRLFLEGNQLKTTSRNQRLAHLHSLTLELDKR